MSIGLSWIDIAFLLLWVVGIIYVLVMAHDWPRKWG